ncbi:hypothetical protein BDZ94DRAFT_275619 [Collybia nuda]|uniref:Mediator complex subunit 8 n=1 Tax=Collybia nuda TaxID=64659 RepID=A0A9P5YBN8_9AGAR|nr:hypothetical protein BDZ94DRAFT_275619 [Collybia nuda]
MNTTNANTILANASSSLPESSTSNSLAHVTTSPLPVSQLESLKFKANQIIDSIQALQRTIENGHQAAMPAWPDILSKYNILLSQTHSFSLGLAGNQNLNSGRTFNGGSSGGPSNPLERVVLHPSVGMTDAQMDSEVAPLLRNQQTLDVLRMENETVRRIAEHMTTKGSIAVLGGAGPTPPRDMTGSGFGFGNGLGAVRGKVEYEDVLRECEEIRSAHDRRIERAVRAVAMLKEKFDWKQRVEVEVEEPEELEWDPRTRMHQSAMEDNRGGGDEGGDDLHDSNGEGEGGEDADGDVGMESPDGGSSDEDEVEGLVNSAMDTQSPISALLSLPLQNGLTGLVPGPIASTTSSSPRPTLPPDTSTGAGL